MIDSGGYYIKIKKDCFYQAILYGWDREIRTPEMTGSEPVALPLGYIPMRKYYCTQFSD